MFLYGNLSVYRKDALKALRKKGVEILPCETVCAFTGEKITEGVLIKKILSPDFTDYQAIKYNSDFCSIDVVSSMVECIPTKKGYCSLRYLSFISTPEKLEFITYNDVMEILKRPPKQFYLVVTESHKKHIAYKAIEGVNQVLFPINTDSGIINFDRSFFDIYYPIIEELYAVKEKEETYFSKNEIKGITFPDYSQIADFGIKKYKEYFDFIKPVQENKLFVFLVDYLKKTPK